MEAVCTPEMSVYFKDTTGLIIPDGNDLLEIGYD
jgi:hypothetical protein